MKPCWARSACGRIPVQRLIFQRIWKANRRDSGWLCPATAAVDFAVEVVEAFLATLGKMCHHVLHKQIHVCSLCSLCSLAASLCFGIIGEVRVRSNICWFAQEKIGSRSLAAYPYLYTNTHPSRSTAGAQRLPKDVCIFAHCRTVGNNFFNSGIC